MELNIVVLTKAISLKPTRRKKYRTTTEVIHLFFFNLACFSLRKDENVHKIFKPTVEQIAVYV